MKNTIYNTYSQEVASLFLLRVLIENKNKIYDFEDIQNMFLKNDINLTLCSDVFDAIYDIIEHKKYVYMNNKYYYFAPMKRGFTKNIDLIISRLYKNTAK